MVRLVPLCFVLFFAVFRYAGGGTGRADSADALPGETMTRGAQGETRVHRADNGHFYVYAMVNGQLVHFLVDTGATLVALSEEDAERVGLKINPAGYQVIGRAAAGTVSGQEVTIGSVAVDGRELRDVRGAVIQGAGVSLLGQSYLSRIGAVEMSGDYMVMR